GISASQGSASSNGANPTSVVGHGGKGRDHLVILLDHAHLRRTSGGSQVVEVIDVDVVVDAPLFGHVILVEDRLDRAHRFAGTAVDAFVGVDVQHPFPFIDAVDWALIDAGLVLHVDTRFSNDVSHAPPSKTIFPLVSHYGY